MFFKSLFIAFSMYSKIPMPKIQWNKNSMRYAFCFFPFVGLFIGAVVYFIGIFMINNEIKKILFSSIMSVIPVIITGGIHLDGFLDTMDGINSYMEKEKRLEILKDHNSGAFAVIGGIIYFILTFGFWSEINKEQLIFVCFGYSISRTLSALSVILFKSAKKDGLAVLFKQRADKKFVVSFLILLFIIQILSICFINIYYSISIILACIISFIYHYYNCMKNFGGITGDLAGYFLQICELLILIFVVLCKGVIY